MVTATHFRPFGGAGLAITKFVLAKQQPREQALPPPMVESVVLTFDYQGFPETFRQGFCVARDSTLLM